MREIEGRFLGKAHSHTASFTSTSLYVDDLPIVVKNKAGDFVSTMKYFKGTQKDIEADSFRTQIDKLADLLNRGKVAEAIFLANIFTWDRFSELCKAGFSETELRDDQGEWAKENSARNPPVIDIQYRGKYHDEVVKDIIEGLRAQGSIVFENFAIEGINNMITIPDGLVKPLKGTPYFFEVKTGFDPKPTDPQKFVYPLICLGEHVTSYDTRTTQLDLTPGALFPSMEMWFIVKGGPGDRSRYFNYCDAIGIRRKSHGP